MDKHYLESQWHQLKGTFKEQWSKFTDNDLMHDEGLEEKLIGKLQEYYNLSYDEAKEQLQNFKEEQYKREDVQ